MNECEETEHQEKEVKEKGNTEGNSRHNATATQRNNRTGSGTICGTITG